MKAWVLVTVVVAAVTMPGRASAEPAIGHTSVFARVPDPGMPAGILVGDDRVLVSTLGLLFQPLTDPRVFSFDLPTGTLRRETIVPRMMPAQPMALFGLAEDPAGDSFVVDMNGMILRVDADSGTTEHYAHFPGSAGGMTTMPVDMVFASDGSAYITDQNLAAIWRIPAGGGTAELWFQDARLAGYLTGPTGIRIDPTGRFLYFTVAISAHPLTAGHGMIYRLPIDDPSASSLQEVFRYPPRSSPFGMAFGASGRIYVALAGANQISVLTPGGDESRFPSAEQNARLEVPYDRPLSLAFDGRGSLLVTNSAMLSPPNPDRMVILEAFVDDVAAPPW